MLSVHASSVPWRAGSRRRVCLWRICPSSGEEWRWREKKSDSVFLWDAGRVMKAIEALFASQATEIF